MHNWNLAILEHLGLLTREQAQKISNEVKIRIHKENYLEAYNEVGAILGDETLKEFEKLKDDVKSLKTVPEPKLAKLKTT